MQIVMVSITRYDDEILRDFIEYHLAQGVNQFVFVAHLASDKTLDILDEYEQKQILNYECFEERDIPATLATDTCRSVSKTLLEIDPDSWVIPMDADCFWWPKEGTLRDTIDRIPGEYNAIEVKQESFLSNLDETGKWYERMVYRDRFPHTLLKHPMPPRQAFKANMEVQIEAGYHRVKFIGKKLCRPQIECLHYATLSWEQFQLKMAIKGPMCETNPGFMGSDSKMYRIWYQHYKMGDLRQVYESISYPAYQNVIIDRRMERWMKEHTPAEHPAE